MKVIAAILGALYVLKWFLGIGRPWVLITVSGNTYDISVPHGSRNGFKYCQLVLCYFPSLRAELAKRFPDDADITRLLDRVTLHAIDKLEADAGYGAFSSNAEFRDSVPEPGGQPAVVDRHSYQVEYYHTLLSGSGTINVIPPEAPLSSLVFHYLELLRAITAAVSAKNRGTLLKCLRTLIHDQQSFPPMTPFKALGAGLARANKLFYTEWLATPQKDIDFRTAHMRVVPPRRLRRAGHAFGMLLMQGSFTSYWLLKYFTGKPLAEVASPAIVLHAAAWVLGGVLAAQAAALVAHIPHATRSMIANALGRHGRHCRFVAIAALVLLIVAGMPFMPFKERASDWFTAVLPGISAAIALGLVSEMAGWVCYSSAIRRAWKDQQGTGSMPVKPQGSDRLLKVGWLPLYFTVPTFSVLVLYSIAVAVLAPLSRRIDAATIFLGTVMLGIAGTVVRLGAPRLFKNYLAGRKDLPTMTLLRKFFADDQSRMLRTLVAPSLGAYATVRTLDDPSYAKGRTRATSSELEATESVLDVLANSSDVIATSDEQWQQIVRKALDESDFVTIDITQMSSAIAWEMVECLQRFHSSRIVLVCFLIGEARKTLGLEQAIQVRLAAEIRKRAEVEGGEAVGGSTSDLEQRFRSVEPPVLYASFPGSLLFRLALVRRLRRCSKKPAFSRSQ